MDKLKVIKCVVAVLSFFLIFGMLSTIGIIYKKVSHTHPLNSEITLSQPQGSSIADYKVAEDTVYVLIKNGGQADRIVILDIKNPQNKTQINLN